MKEIKDDQRKFQKEHKLFFQFFKEKNVQIKKYLQNVERKLKKLEMDRIKNTLLVRDINVDRRERKKQHLFEKTTR